MRSGKIYLILILLTLIAALFTYHYIFSIYEVTYKIYPARLYADNKSDLIIESVPLNSFGWRAPLRNSPSEFTIIEGADLVEIVFIDRIKGIIKIKAKERAGKVLITIKPKFSMFPSTIEIFIEANFALAKK
jgi:hypothetical protein